MDYSSERDDVAFVSRAFEASKPHVLSARRAQYLLVDGGRPPPEGADVLSDGDGAYVVGGDGERCALDEAGPVLARAEARWRDAPSAPLDVLDWEGQASRLAARMGPRRDARKPPGSAEAWPAGPSDGPARHDPEARIRRQVLEECAPGGVERSRGGGERNEEIEEAHQDEGECAGGCGFFAGRNQRFCLHCKAERAGDGGSDGGDDDDGEE